MPGRPRKDIIDESRVGVYHVFSRCVRQAFLCGFDPISGTDYGYRRNWIEERLQFLANIFAIDACSFAILSNHYHLLLRNRPDLAREWTDEEVVKRWWQLRPERLVDATTAHLTPAPLEIASFLETTGWVQERRKRLSSPSWFMKYLNQNIARRANREDRVKGHFWQERFGARSLDDELSVLTCSVYIDLNEIRAGLADSPETSRFTSAFQRLSRLKMGEQALLAGDLEKAELYAPESPDYWLCPINEGTALPQLSATADADEDASEKNEEREADPAGQEEADDKGTSLPHTRKPRHGFLPISLAKYLALLDLTGRCLTVGKSGTEGAIDAKLDPILHRIGITPDEWVSKLRSIEDWFGRMLGPPPCGRDTSPLTR